MISPTERIIVKIHPEMPSDGVEELRRLKINTLQVTKAIRQPLHHPLHLQLLILWHHHLSPVID